MAMMLRTGHGGRVGVSSFQSSSYFTQNSKPTTSLSSSIHMVSVFFFYLVPLIVFIIIIISECCSKSVNDFIPTDLFEILFLLVSKANR